MKPYRHQLDLAKEIANKLRKYKLAYLTAEERTGKTLSSILVAEKSNFTNILIVTKKNALAGWEETLTSYKVKKDYTLTNYHQIKKLTKLKNKFDFVILDESHNYISGYPKKSQIWKELYPLTKNKVLLFISATPFAQGMQQIYNPLALSSHSPFKGFKNFYEWFSAYGVESFVMTGRGLVKQYNKTKADLVLEHSKHLFVTKTRKELGFKHEPIDKLHYITLSQATKDIYNKLVKDKIATYQGHEIVLDSVLKERLTLHQIEGSTLKNDNNYLEIGNDEKINYILNTFGDCKSNVIMCHYIFEQSKLTRYFKNAKILSATKHSEGISLSDSRNLIIYSQDFSTAKHIQRRARQCNINRKEPITVHYLVVKGAISEQVYNTVCINKKNFTDKIYKEKII